MAGHRSNHGGGSVVKGLRQVRPGVAEKMHKECLIEKAHALVQKARYKHL